MFRILANSSLTYGERGALIWIAVRNHIDPGFTVSAMDMATALGMSLPMAKQTLRRATAGIALTMNP